MPPSAGPGSEAASARVMSYPTGMVGTLVARPGLAAPGSDFDGIQTPGCAKGRTTDCSCECGGLVGGGGTGLSQAGTNVRRLAITLQPAILRSGEMSSGSAAPNRAGSGGPPMSTADNLRNEGEPRQPQGKQCCSRVSCHSGADQTPISAGRTCEFRQASGDFGRSTTPLARLPAVRTFAGTTSATPVPSWPRRPARLSRNSWAASASQPPAPPCASNTRPQTAIGPTSVDHSPGEHAGAHQHR
jgi:hypothetical protein